MSPTLISFVRHGLVHNPRKIYYGHLPKYRLSQDGISQAKVGAQMLEGKGVAAIFSSPLLRALQTARAIQTLHTLAPLYRSNLLNEVRTPFDGHPISQMTARNWDLYTDVPAGYEQPCDVLTRARKFISRARQKYAGQHIVAVTHGDLIAFLILWAKAAPINPEQKRDFRLFGLPDQYPAPGSISTFAFQSTDREELPTVEYISSSQ